MARRGVSRDSRQGSLFDPADAKKPNGSLNFDREWRAALSQAITESGLSREEIAADMERLLGNDPDYPVSKSLIDAWTAPSKSDWRFPLIYLPAFIEATGRYWLLDRLARFCGRIAIDDSDAGWAEVGMIDDSFVELRRRKRELLTELKAKRGRR